MAEREVTRAEGAFVRVMRRHRLDLLVQVRLTARPADEAAVLVQAGLALPRTRVRTQLASPVGFAATLAAHRLDCQLVRISAGRLMRGWPDPARRPLAYSSGRASIVRRKVCPLGAHGLDEAVAMLDALDYDALLFTDRGTGEDAIVYWSGPFGIRLARQHSMRPPVRAGVPWTVDPHPARTSTETEAAEWLCRYGLPFVFCTDPSDRRGRLLYRRYDGDIGVVVPAGTGS
ncbi:sigma 54 modulation/S30EA ribosomal C-terminal domain-containing protein [Nocardia sp. CDC159]|uniref:Sigma 54 modulation/S30EA ribosomal C-terminal domain-containing protein n=1 Tax=Nocardia pulmonis TaxID=2951408 RepID=A0A9X2E6I2_9NOCA|nr:MULTISPECIES: sigma 54 modulation/S30EA ribosomal C-terminal domain-containing protein [Nocardia]MCM6772408.1 sigma 54 modulation/S30EA ribosomal C-terminal domain-containing protein [Nocardia pulmonis]MCM6784934.1 sigma 54 modulation/S30EA ribosomal C-terminal domain-containing protein [Nocardia sp. CDC159]